MMIERCSAPVERRHPFVRGGVALTDCLFKDGSKIPEFHQNSLPGCSTVYINEDLLV